MLSGIPPQIGANSDGNQVHLVDDYERSINPGERRRWAVGEAIARFKRGS